MGFPPGKAPVYSRARQPATARTQVTTPTDSTTHPAAPALSAAERRGLRQLAHQLKPVVRLGTAGLSEGVLAEIDRALTDHELIKLRLSGDRDERSRQRDRIRDELGAAVIQQIGATLTVLRSNPDTKPHLSTLKRLGHGSYLRSIR